MDPTWFVALTYSFIFGAMFGDVAKPGLSRTRTLLAALGDPHKQLRFVHVAGTNGQGSTAAMLASCLQAAGYRVGLFTSPFINRFNERIQVDGQQIRHLAKVEVAGSSPVIRSNKNTCKSSAFLFSTN